MPNFFYSNCFVFNMSTFSYFVIIISEIYFFKLICYIFLIFINHLYSVYYIVTKNNFFYYKKLINLRKIKKNFFFTYFYT